MNKRTSSIKIKICKQEGCNYPRYSKDFCKVHYNLSKGVTLSSLKVKDKPKKIRYKPTGERELFLEIWDEREHYCQNCGDYLGEEPLIFYFSHIVPKSRDNSLRLVKSNINLECWECHQLRDFGTAEKLAERKKRNTRNALR